MTQPIDKSNQLETSLSMLELAQQNEGKAWDKLVELYGPVIYARCRQKWQLESTEAENIGQEVFIAVARKLGDFNRQRTGSFRKWIRTITDNKCKDLLKKKQVVEAEGGSAAKQQLERVADYFNENEIQEDQSEKAILVRQAMKAIENQFSERDCKVFWSFAVEKQDRNDVAQKHGISSEAVSVYCCRIRKRLIEIYEDLLRDDI